MKSVFVSVCLILISTCLANGQEWDDTCDEAKERASRDFKNGDIKAISYGLVIVADPDFEKFYDEYLLEKYKIHSIDGGCVTTESFECYSGRMFELIKEKYGSNILEKARTEAEKLYPKAIKTNFDDDSELSDFENIFDESSGVYVLVETQPEFPGGIDSLFSYVDAEMTKVSLPKGHFMGRSYIGFVVDSTGRPFNVKVLKGSFVEYDSALVNILKRMPLWKPGMVENRNVSVRMIIPFKYK